MSCSSYLQQAFDAHCHLCPSLIDILTIDLVPECPSTPISCLLHEHHSAFLFQDHEHSIVLDTGASISVSPFKDDFLSWDKHSSLPTLQSLTGTASVLGYGMVNWPVQTDQGLVHSIKTKAYFVPDAAVRLLSPQRYISTSTERSLSMLPSAIKFQLDRNSSVTLAYSGLPSVPLVSRVKRGNLFAGMTSNVISPQNTNLSPYQKEVLAWHYRLGHFHLPWIERLTRPRIASELPGIPLRNKRPVNTTMQHVKCRACQTAKASRRPEGVHVERAIPTKEMALQRDIIRVGAKVATDQFVSAVRGRRFHTFGKENEGQKFTGGTVFVDISSGFISACMQVSLKAQETILAKRRFERDLHLHGHKIVQYLGDNGVFRSEEFSLELQKKGQTIEFCGVGAHHQNGVAERSIRTISDSARSMLIHAAIHWPEAVDLSLWPMAVEYATYLYNRTPGRVSDTSPMEHVSGQRSNLEDIRSARVWGCPAFVLDPRKQDGKKLPRWVPRARRGQFLGRSRSHASSVGLIRNLNTGSISTQFHVVYDDFFTTVSSNEQNMALVETWPHLLKFSCEDLLFDDDTRELAPPLENEWLTTEEARLRTIKLIPRRVNPPIPVPEGGINEAPTPNREEPGNDVPLDLAQHGTQVDSDESDDESIPEVEHRRNPRRQLRGFNRRYHGSEFVNFIHDEQQDYAQESSNINFLNNIIYNFASTISNNQQVLRMEQDMSYSVDQFNFVHDWHPAYLATKASSEDNPTLRQAMNSPERHGWIESMERELTSLEDMDVYEEVNRYEAKGNPILDSTWAFKRKRYPDGSIRKLKGRLCVRGDQQIEGIDFFETYAPVVQWATVRMLLIISFTHKLTTKQVDYTNAFVHAPINEDVYVELPPMYSKPNKIWKLKKSLYGLRQSPLNFFMHLKTNLEARKWKASDIDPCLFFKNNIMCLIYVDDCLFFSTSKERIDKEIASLKEAKPDSFLIEEEDDVAGFLGILIIKKTDHVELTQTGLIQRVLEAMGLQDSSSKETPAEKGCLTKDLDGPPKSESWNYRSVVGMLMYLATNSRPDISFAVNQCARFSNDPRRIHEKALKRIGRYLKGTKDRGMIMKPDPELAMDMFADADFAGLFTKEEAHDPSSVRSRAGWIVTLGGVPVTWKSKLMQEIALSTMEAEYMALSLGMRELIGNRKLIKEIEENGGIKRNSVSKISKVYEDNHAALKHAVTALPKLMPRTKHIGVKYHWFKSKIKMGEIEMFPISTKLQKADIFTKGLTAKDFREKRELILGW